VEVSETSRFPIRFTGANHAMVVLGLTSGNSHVDVADDRVEVRMGWAFRVEFERSSVQSVADDRDAVTGWGAHGWRGVWLVNGSSSGIVRIELDPPARAKVCGVPVELRVLRVAVEDPAGLRECLATT
jgi:hypothetical protein